MNIRFYYIFRTRNFLSSASYYGSLVRILRSDDSRSFVSRKSENFRLGPRGSSHSPLSPKTSEVYILSLASAIYCRCCQGSCYFNPSYRGYSFSLVVGWFSGSLVSVNVGFITLAVHQVLINEGCSASIASQSRLLDSINQSIPWLVDRCFLDEKDF